MRTTSKKIKIITFKAIFFVCVLCIFVLRDDLLFNISLYMMNRSLLLRCLCVYEFEATDASDSIKIISECPSKSKRITKVTDSTDS